MPPIGLSPRSRFANLRAVILCGGRGTRLQEATGGLKPKPLVEVGGRPILWHIMKGYAEHGVQDFVLCLGQLSTAIKDYFLHYHAMNTDFTLKIGAAESIKYHGSQAELDWHVTLADTGAAAMTGARLARVRRYLGDETFMMTYGDGVSNVDVTKLLAFHRSQGKIATVTGVRPVGRFGRLNLSGHNVTSFEEKPEDGDFINGGFFVFEPRVFDYLSTDPDCVLERDPLSRLANDGEMVVYQHTGFWQCMDTYRDLLFLEELWRDGRAPWKTWTDGD